MESQTLFVQLAFVLGIASVVGFFVKVLKLPLLVAYLIAGVLLSGAKVFDGGASQALTSFPEIGIAFVLFFIGMELDLKEIKDLGKPILVAGLGQILISIIAGFTIASLFNLPQKESLYLGIGLAFSSTIVVVKMLLEKKDLTSLYGKLSLGITLLEDLVAIVVLMAMTVSSSYLHLGLQNNFPLLSLFIKGVILLLTALFFSRFILSRVFNRVADSAELLFLSALAWCFIFVSASLVLGFSVVIGAFLAGVALANSPFHFEIQGKVKPLRDFFVTLFFVYLGSQVSFNLIPSVLPLIVVFTLYALFFKAIIFCLILGLFGFRKHTIFQTAINLSQISEFSLIILVVGLRQHEVSQGALTAMALTGVLSIILSSILISSSRVAYKILKPVVGFFEHGNSPHLVEKKKDVLGLEDHVILVGAHKIGGEIVRFLKRERIPFLVLDFNPEVIEHLTKEGINSLYGDVGDPEILDFLSLEKAKLIISTAQDVEDNLMLLSESKRRRVTAILIVRAVSLEDAKRLYKARADYVILPEVVSGDFVSQLLKTHWPNIGFFKDRQETELRKLASRGNLA